jgi:cytochrome c oxidase assembly protein subunit 11
MARTCDRPSLDRRNSRLALVTAAVVVGMLGLAYASAPLYRLFCQVTGYAGTPKINAGAATNAYDLPILSREMTVRFDSTTAPDLPWRFEPAQKSVRFKIGEENLVFYRATNVSDEPIVGTATFNVTPFKAAAYFNKIECFCFTEQRLEPGQTVDMPVTFFVDPAIADDHNLDEVQEITLSYTFFKVKE